MADVGEGAGERERDVAFRSRLAVEGRLVHAGRHQQRPEEQRQQCDDEGVPGRREPAAVLAARRPPSLPV